MADSFILPSNERKTNTARRIVVSIVQDRGHFLIVRRRKKEGCLHWQFPGGAQANINESEQATAERETFEETNIICRAIRKFGERIHPQTNVKIAYWLCDYVKGKPRVKDHKELDKVKWVSGKEAIKAFTSELFRPVREYLEKRL